MSSPGTCHQEEKWRRGAPVWATIAQFALLASLAPAALDGYWGSARVNLWLCLAAGAWSLIALRPPLRRRPAVMAVFVAGVVALSLVLAIRDPWFGFYAFVGFVYSAILLPWPWLLLGVGATDIVAATSQTAGVNRTAPVGLLVYLGVIAINMLVSFVVIWSLHRATAQSRQRGQMVDELRESNRRLEVALAENAGLQRQLLVQAREAGILDERQRMAREIHDTLAQGLTGIVAQLQAAEHAAGEPAEWRKHFAAATGLARESLSEARRSVDALRPEPLENASLSQALAGVAARWSALHGIPAWVTTTGTTRPVAPDAEAALLRTAQEALANVARHAQASRVGVTLSYLENEVALDVRDDGRGFDPAVGPARRRDAGPQGAPGAQPAGGFGLLAMRQRIEGLAGTLQVESEPGAGTGISAHIPAEQAEARG